MAGLAATGIFRGALNNRVYFDDPDGHSLEYFAMLDEPPRPKLGIIPLPSWQSRHRLNR